MPEDKVFPTLTHEQQAKVEAVVDLMFSQNPMVRPHPLLAMLREYQLEAAAVQLRRGP